MDENLEEEIIDESLEEEKAESTEDEDWARMHKKVQYFEILLLVISFLCLVSLILNAINFWLFSRG